MESRQNKKLLTPSTPAVPNCCCLKGPAPYWPNPPFLIFDIRALWRSVAKCKASTGSAAKGLRHQECRLKRSGLKQSLNNAHEQRPGVHIQTSLLTIIVKDTRYHPISGDKPI